MSELRSHPRVGLSLHLFITLEDGKRMTATTENLSSQGAMITIPSAVKLRPSTDVVLRFEIPHANSAIPVPVERTATVRWSSELVPGLIGVEFERALSDEAREALYSHDDR